MVGGFVDALVSQLLGLDPQCEVGLALVPLGRTTVSAVPAAQAAPLTLETVPLSKTEVDYPAVRAMHEVSSLSTNEEAAAWRGGTPISTLPLASGQLFPLSPHHDDEGAGETIERVILRRGSSRQFVRRSISFPQLSSMLHRATRGIPADFLEPEGATLNDLYLIVHAVDDLPTGAYVYHREADALELLEEGDFRRGSRRPGSATGPARRRQRPTCSSLRT